MTNLQQRKTHSSPKWLNTTLWLAGGFFLISILFSAMLVLQTPAGQPFANFFNWLFAINSVQTMWFITRAAGLTSYLLLWLSVAWGLAVSTKILDTLLHRSFTYDFHQFISLLAIGFILLHMGVLLFDGYLPYTLPQILLPFLSPYRPTWVALGVIGFWLTILVTVTFYLRSKIGMKAFRSIHVFSLLAYLGVTFHGFLSGTDSSLITVQLMYAVTFLSVVFLTTYWFIFKRTNKAKEKVVVITAKTSSTPPVAKPNARAFPTTTKSLPH